MQKVNGKTESRMRCLKPNKEIHNCPACGSKNVNQVEFDKYYCLDCCVEFDNERIYTIAYDGSLVDYQINEFTDLN